MGKSWVKLLVGPWEPLAHDTKDDERFWMKVNLAVLGTDRGPLPGLIETTGREAAAELARVREEFYSTGPGKGVRELAARLTAAERAAEQATAEAGRVEADWATATAAGSDTAVLEGRLAGLRATADLARKRVGVLAEALKKAKSDAAARLRQAVVERIAGLKEETAARLKAAEKAVSKATPWPLVELMLARMAAAAAAAAGMQVGKFSVPE